MTIPRDAARCPGSRRGGMARRDFLRRTAAGTGLVVLSGRGWAAEPAGEELPKRVLGRTKAEVTILGLGTAPVGEGPPDTDEAEKIFGTAMDRGVTYIDTARIYGNAEEALGRLVPGRRDRLFLATKVWTDNAARAEKLLATSLRLLKTDYVDLCHIHHVGGKNVDRVLARDGVLAYLLEQKEKGTVRFIGMSGHCRPPRFLRVLETGHIDVVMPVMNYADRNIYNFEGTVLPACRKRHVGVVAMKVYAGIKGGFPNHKKGYVGCATEPSQLPRAMAYALDLPGVSVANVGPYTLEHAVQNVDFARRYKPLTDEQREALLERGRALAKQLGPRYGPVS
ncbi:MAG: aldo/keto reductase [Candidatus Brocadiia bacterium]